MYTYVITYVGIHNLIYVNNVIVNFIVTDTDSHELVTESSSEESDEEMVVQDWRRNRFL